MKLSNLPPGVTDRMIEEQAGALPMRYIAIGPHCWGVGTSIKQAIAHAKKHWPTFALKYTAAGFDVYETDDEKAYVNDLGNLCYRTGAHFAHVQKSSLTG